MRKGIRWSEFRIKGSFGTLFFQARKNGLNFPQEVEVPVRQWHGSCVRPCEIIYFILNLKEEWSFDHYEFENAAILLAERLRFFGLPLSMADQKIKFEEWICSRGDLYYLGDCDVFDKEECGLADCSA